MAPGRRFGIYWSRLARFCLLGTVVMFLWLMFPVVRCSWAAFRDTPMSEVRSDPALPEAADTERVAQGRGFWNNLTTSVKQCYRETPLFGQEPWKHQLMIGLGAATILAWLIGGIVARRRRTFTS